jgi:hypothetical protein
MYQIAIPSYKRADQLAAKTIATLSRMNINPECIHVFVVPEEYDIYVQTLQPDTYHHIIPGNPGLVEQREFIENHFPENTHIVFLDDDICDIDLSITEWNTLHQFFKHAFHICHDTNAFIWSVYPVHNPFFRKNKQPFTTHLNYCIGAFYGIINRPNHPMLKINIARQGNKEDVERTIRYWNLDQATVRFNQVGFKTKYYGTGGLGSLKERLEHMKNNTIALHEQYPDITRIKIRKNGLYEITFPKKHAAKVETVLFPPMDITFLEPLDPVREDIHQLLQMLHKTTIPLYTNKMGRATTFGAHRSFTLGVVKSRIKRQFGLSYCSKKHPALYDAIKAFGQTFVPFHFDAIHVNHNVVCPRHLDAKNAHQSCIVSIGEYEGGDLIIESPDQLVTRTVNTKHQPLIFDATKMYHYNTPITQGNKYSLVFFSTKK